MNVLFVQKLIFSLLLALIAVVYHHDSREPYRKEALKEILKSRSRFYKFLDYLTMLGISSGLILITFSKTWFWFPIGFLLYIVGILFHSRLLDASRDAWIQKWHAAKYN